MEVYGHISCLTIYPDTRVLQNCLVRYMNHKNKEFKKLKEYYQEGLKVYDQICSYVLIVPVSKIDIHKTTIIE